MDKIKLFNGLLKDAEHVVITTHIFPDADGIGSQIALCLALRLLGKNAICVNQEPLLDRYKYLDPQNVIISHKQYKKQKNPSLDLLIIVDANSPLRIGKDLQQTLEEAKKFVFVDHHPCSPAVQAIHCIDTKMAATGQLVGKIIESYNINFTKEMALSLYTSILIDTSSFRYPTVTGDTHRMLGSLLDTGINPPVAYNRIYGTKKTSHMKLLGEVLRTTSATSDEKISWIVVKEKWVEESHSDHEDTHSFINHLLILDNIQVAVMFRNVGDIVKISFRSNGVVDVGEIAQALGGGGHNHSAATVIEGKLEKVVQDTIEKLQLMLDLMA